MAEAKESHHDFWDLPADSAQSCSFDPGVEVGVGGWLETVGCPNLGMSVLFFDWLLQRTSLPLES